MSKRAVLYARVSKDDRVNASSSLGGQLEMCQEYAQEQGHQIVARLSEDDRGASGASFELPELNRVLEMARAGEFDILVVRELDRLSRKLAKQLIVEEELKRAGVQIEYVLGNYAESPEGNLMKNVRAVIAEYERLKIAERMSRGRRQRARSGNVIVHGRPPYGYRVVREGDRTTLAIHEPEARVVRLIFYWYVYGDGEHGALNISDITRQLTKMGVPTWADTKVGNRSGVKKSEHGVWNRSAVHRILGKELYTGVWHYGKFTETAEGKRIRNPDDYLIPVEVPAIVDRELWDMAQAQLMANKRNARRNQKYDYLLGKRLTCGVCGAKMHGTTDTSSAKLIQRYRCPASAKCADYARECDLPTFRADQVEPAVWDWIRSFLKDPKKLAEGLQTEREELERENAPLRERVAVVDDLLAEHQRQLERLLDLYLSEDFPKEVMIERRSRLEQTIGSLQRERLGLAEQVESRTLTDEQIQNVQEFAEKVAAGLGVADNDPKTRRRIIEDLNVQVTLTIENGAKVAYVQCLLGESALAIVSRRTRPAPGRCPSAGKSAAARATTRWPCQPPRPRCRPG